MTGSPVTLPSPELPGGPRSALVVATTRYADPSLRQLRAPGTDAVELAAVLADPAIGGFAVTSVLDRPSQEIRVSIDEFLQGRATEELVVLYVSCHGITDTRRRLHFAASDTFASRIASTGVEAEWVNQRLDECRARRQILILDCCFSGAFARGSKGMTELGLERLTEPGQGRAVLTASSATEYSFESLGDALPAQTAPGTSSVFTAALLAGLRDGRADQDQDGFVSVDEAYAYAYQQVRASGVPQTPQRHLSGGQGDILLARSPAGRRVVAARLPKSLRVNLENPLPRFRIAAVQELGEWLISEDLGKRATAQRHLQEVADSDIPKVAAEARLALQALLPPNVQAIVPANLVPGAAQSYPDQASPQSADLGASVSDPTSGPHSLADSLNATSELAIDIDTALPPSTNEGPLVASPGTTEGALTEEKVRADAAAPTDDVDPWDEPAPASMPKADGSPAESDLSTINAIVEPQLPKIGDRLPGTVVKTMTLGALISLRPGKDGWLHISEVRKLVGGKRVDNVGDVLAVGQTVQVELTDIDRHGRLSLAAVLPNLTPEDVRNKRFTQTQFRRGYDEREVDDFLDLIADAIGSRLDALHAEGARASSSETTFQFDAASVAARKFTQTQLRRGYDEKEVDDFLDEVIRSLKSLDEALRK